MPSVYDAVVSVLTPIVGRPAAEICVHSSAVELYKSSEKLGTGDLPVIEANIRRSLAAFATAALLDSAIVEIEAQLR